MTNANSFNRFQTYFQCQLRADRDEEKSKILHPFVTISRKAGAGGITIGEELCDYLRKHDNQAKNACPWTVFDKNLVEEVIREHSLSDKVARFMSEDRISEVADILDELFGLHPSQWTLVHKTSQTILHLAQMGNAIIVGRGANVITRKRPNGFHVRLVGSWEKRIEYMRDRFNLSRKEAVAMIKKRDLGRKNYLKKYFDKDIDDPLLYDLLINTDNVAYEEAARIIGEAVISLGQRLQR